MSQPSNTIIVRAKFPGGTMQEALEAAEAEQKSLPFNVTWSEIRLITVYESEDEENGWTWIATLKAKGLSQS